MIIKKRLPLMLALVLAAVVFPMVISADDLMTLGLTSFPSGTIRVEYSSPVKLRTLPDYAALSQRYVGPRLQALENSLTQLGVQQEDVDELVIGWQARGGGMDISGLAQGRFNPQGIASQAKAQGIAASRVGGTPAYCFGSGATSNCVVILGETLGAFGTLDSLAAILKVRAGEVPSAGSDASFAKHVEGGRTDAPIWGVAVGAAVEDWFKGWLPNQGSLKMDLTQTFKPVESLAYNVQAADKVRLDVKMDCKTSQDAGNLRQVMQGLKLFQQMAWQGQNPNMPNPFQSLEVSLDDRQVRMNLTTAYAELEAGSPPGKS